MHVLVTRPMPDATATAEAVRAFGHEASIIPLLTIAFNDIVSLAAHSARAAQAILITSANGVRALARGSGSRPALRALPLYAIGPASAAAARGAGFRTVEAAAGSIESLAALVRGACSPDKGALVHVAGRHRAGNLAGLLQAAGFTVHQITAYEARPDPTAAAPLRIWIQSGQGDAVLLYSPRTAARFRDLVTAEGLEAPCRRLQAFCLSPAVAAALSPLVLAACHVAPAPCEKALLDLLNTAKSE